jgi:carboxyl-terminal processing protease
VSDISARADTKDSLKHLNLFATIFDKVRADYVNKVDERQLMESAINGMTAWLGAQPIHLDAKNPKEWSIYLTQFGDIYDKLRADYAGRVDERQLIEKAIDGMLTSLDSGSFLLVAKGSSEPSGNGGVGLELTKGGNFIKVVTPIDDTPSSRAGIQPGDLVAAIDGVSTEGLRIDQAAAKLRGPINSPVRLTILRGADRKKIDLKMVREFISIKSVRARHQDQDVSYIRISQFDEETAEGLRKAIAKVREEIPEDKFKGYILDLRNNPGGLLDQSIQVANALIERGEIVSLRGRTSDDTQRYIARPGNLSGGKPVVVLINGGTASGSEIVAAALQFHKRAAIIGTRSFGNGSVQTLIPLDGTDDMLRLTTSRIFTPAGR